MRYQGRENHRADWRRAREKFLVSRLLPKASARFIFPAADPFQGMTVRNHTLFRMSRAALQAACRGPPRGAVGSSGPTPSTPGGAAGPQRPARRLPTPAGGSRGSHPRPGLLLSTSAASQPDGVFCEPVAERQRLHPPHAASALPAPSEM